MAWADSRFVHKSELWDGLFTLQESDYWSENFAQMFRACGAQLSIEQYRNQRSMNPRATMPANPRGSV